MSTNKFEEKLNDMIKLVTCDLPGGGNAKSTCTMLFSGAGPQLNNDHSPLLVKDLKAKFIKKIIHHFRSKLLKKLIK